MSQQALETSDLLNMRFAAKLLGTTTPRKLMVAAPDGPSSDGGKKVRQSIVLAPANDPSAGTVMVGWLDIAQKRAELRVHAVVKAQFEQRYRIPFDVPQDAYDALMRDVQSMLGFQEIQVAVVQAMPDGQAPESRATMAEMPRAAASESGGGKNGMMVVLLVGGAVLLGVAAIAWVLLHR